MWWPFYVVSVNHALYRLGIEPHHVPARIRQDVQAAGVRGAYTPQEMATAVAYFLHAGSTLPAAARVTIHEWLRKGKVRSTILDQYRRATQEIAE
jgi:hypothetical protein